MERFFKKRLGFIIILIIIFVFPISLSNQARLNMKIIITGLAIDKVDEGYEVTAQIAKTSPGTETPGTSATINFVSDKDETLVGAIAKLTYKAGKVSAFSHTNFVIIGNKLMNDDVAEVLDYFVRNKTIKSSALLLFANEKASDELKKTKDVELSVAFGLQKVFLFKENESDGEMMTILNFLKDSKTYSKTSTASVLKLMKNGESSKTSGDGESSNNDSSGGKDDSSGVSSGGQSSEDKYQYFEALSPIVCCVDGKFVGKLENKDEISGYMITKDKAKSEDISISGVTKERLKNAKIGIRVKNKNSKFSVRYENGIPCLDIKILINNCDVEDLHNDIFIGEFSKAEYDEIKKSISDDTKKKIATCFKKSKEMKADIFHAYDIAMKYHYNQTSKLFDTMEDFLENLRLNIEVEVVRINY